MADEILNGFNKWQASLKFGEDMIVIRSNDLKEFKVQLREAIQIRKKLLRGEEEEEGTVGLAAKYDVSPEDCPGHSLYIKTVRKEGPNKGRKFVACKHCDYFAWASEKDLADLRGGDDINF